MAKIVYRSHIEIRADLIRENPKGPQAQVHNGVLYKWELRIWDGICIHTSTYTDVGLPLVGHQAGGRLRLTPRGQLRARRRAHGERGMCFINLIDIQLLSFGGIAASPKTLDLSIL